MSAAQSAAGSAAQPTISAEVLQEDLVQEGVLARLLRRAEADPAFYRGLMAQCRDRRRLITPARERASLAAVVRELTPQA